VEADEVGSYWRLDRRSGGRPTAEDRLTLDYWPCAVVEREPRPREVMLGWQRLRWRGLLYSRASTCSIKNDSAVSARRHHRRRLSRHLLNAARGRGSVARAASGSLRTEAAILDRLRAMRRPNRSRHPSAP
jgi:hypothetical protein